MAEKFKEKHNKEIMDYQITPEWRISLEQDYQHRTEDGQLVLWTTGRTILAVAFRYAKALQKEQLLQELKARAEANKVETFSAQTDTLALFAMLEPEDIGEGHLRLALHAFTLSEHTCLQTAYYFDKPADLPWAIQTWEAIQHTPQFDQERDQ